MINPTAPPCPGNFYPTCVFLEDSENLSAIDLEDFRFVARNEMEAPRDNTLHKKKVRIETYRRKRGLLGIRKKWWERHEVFRKWFWTPETGTIATGDLKQCGRWMEAHCGILLGGMWVCGEAMDTGGWCGTLVLIHADVVVLPFIVIVHLDVQAMNFKEAPSNNNQKHFLPVDETARTLEVRGANVADFQFFGKFRREDPSLVSLAPPDVHDHDIHHITNEDLLRPASTTSASPSNIPQRDDPSFRIPLQQKMTFRFGKPRMDLESGKRLPKEHDQADWSLQKVPMAVYRYKRPKKGRAPYLIKKHTSQFRIVFKSKFKKTKKKMSIGARSLALPK